MTAFDRFWCGRDVLVTGHTGFKGSWLTLMLRRLGAQVFGYSDHRYADNNIYAKAGISSLVNDEMFADIRDLSALSLFISQSKPSVIFHLAAQPLVSDSYEDPLKTLSTNIMGSANVIHAGLESPNLRALVNITTDKVYLDEESIWPYRETDTLGGKDPYAASKACSELVTDSFFRSYYRKNGIGLATARAGNVFGGGDWSHRRIVPDVFRALELGQPLIVKNPNAVRPWQYVLDAVFGYLQLAEKITESPEPLSGAWNFGPDSEDVVSVYDLVSKIQILVKDLVVEFEADIDVIDSETMFLRLDSSKARYFLDWESGFDLSEGLTSTVEWYQKCLRGEDLDNFSVCEIDRYLTEVSRGYSSR